MKRDQLLRINIPPSSNDQQSPSPATGLWRLQWKKLGYAEGDLWSTKVTVISIYLYLAAVIVLWLLLRFGTDHYWFPTILAYGPRWFYLLPLAVLMPFVLLRRRWMLLFPTAVLCLIVLFPIMGLCIPLGLPTSDAGGDEGAMRVLTLNMGASLADACCLEGLILEHKPDVVLLQECGWDTEKKLPEGWNVERAGSLLVASPYSIHRREVATSSYPPNKRPPKNALCVNIETPAGAVDFCSLQIRSARWGILPVLDRHTVMNPSHKYILKREIRDRHMETEELTAWMEQFSGPLIIAGDFNMPPDSVIYRQYWGQYENAFSSSGLGFGRTRWTTMKRITYGIRIDHILTSEHWRPERCWVGPTSAPTTCPCLPICVSASDSSALLDSGKETFYSAGTGRGRVNPKLSDRNPKHTSRRNDLLNRRSSTLRRSRLVQPAQLA